MPQGREEVIHATSPRPTTACDEHTGADLAGGLAVGTTAGRAVAPVPGEPELERIVP
jgi:hypothetical protein